MVMNVYEIKAWLIDNLPEFEFTTGEEAKQPESNWNSIQVFRDGQELIIDVSKVDNEARLNKLKDYIQGMWSQVEAKK